MAAALSVWPVRKRTANVWSIFNDCLLLRVAGKVPRKTSKNRCSKDAKKMFAFFSELHCKRLPFICACIWFQTEDVAQGVFLHRYFSIFSTILSVDKVIILGTEGTYTVSAKQCVLQHLRVKRPAHAASKSFYWVTSSLPCSSAWTNQDKTLGWDNIFAKLGTL